MSAEKTVTNMAIRAAYDSLAEVVGPRARDMIFKNAGLARVLENTPEYTFDREFTNEEQAAIYLETINLIGAAGAQGLIRRMGYKNVEIATLQFHVLDFMKDLPPDEKIQKAFEFSQSVLNKGRVIIDEAGRPALDVFDCLTCKGVKSKTPCCAQYAGGLQFLADWTYGKGVFAVVEAKCMAKGDETCLFVLQPR
jgi:predicted hydrocarbon binding protein